MTGAERRLWSAIRGRQLADVNFRRPAPIGPYIVDFRRLNVQVFPVLRFWNHQVNDRTPHPNPPHQGEGTDAMIAHPSLALPIKGREPESDAPTHRPTLTSHLPTANCQLTTDH